jgi:hypothetical protein
MRSNVESRSPTLQYCGLKLPTRHPRPRRRAAEQRDEVAASKLIEMHPLLS